MESNKLLKDRKLWNDQDFNSLKIDLLIQYNNQTSKTVLHEIWAAKAKVKTKMYFGEQKTKNSQDISETNKQNVSIIIQKRSLTVSMRKEHAN